MSPLIVRSFHHRWMYFCLLLLLTTHHSGNTAEPVGHRPEVKVTAATRIDWTFVLANQSLKIPPEDWLANYDSTEQNYEIYVPKGLTAKKPAGLVLFISPGERGLGLDSFRKICDDQKLIFATPHNAGNNTDMRQRVRIILDVLDDVRRHYPIEAERSYIGGFSGGGRVACAIAFTLPEYFGGAMPVCAAGDLRQESCLRQRVVDRLSVALLTGDGDFNLGEVERFRGPMLANVGVRTKVWVAPRSGHAVPPIETIEGAVRWLESGVEARRKFAKKYPASSMTAEAKPTREQSAKALLAEGKQRLTQKASVYTGLMQLQGVMVRWPDLDESEAAKKILLKYESEEDRPWELEDISEQRRFLIARAKGLSDYATGTLPDQYQAQRKAMLAAAIELWKQVLEDGQDEAAVAEGKKRMPDLQKLHDEQE